MPLLAERRAVSYAIVFGIWAEVFVYCLLHDQYLVRLAPEHFTVYHPPLWGITDESLLAAAWAFRASIGPGLGLGLAALFVGRAGRRPRVPVASMLKGVAAGLAVTELCGLAAGAYSWLTRRPLYPAILYPELTRPLLTSQSIQLTCYGVGAVAGLTFLLFLDRYRRPARGAAARRPSR